MQSKTDPFPQNGTGSIPSHCASHPDLAILALRGAGLLLGLVGLAKLLSAYSGVPYLAHPDPVITFASNHTVLLAAGVLEMAIAFGVLWRPNSLFANSALLALCSSMAIYRTGLAMLQTRPPCPCLGRASDWLHLTPAQADHLAKVLLFAFAALSILGIARHFHRQPQT